MPKKLAAIPLQTLVGPLTRSVCTPYSPSYNNSYCLVFRPSDNQLNEVTEYCDTELVTAALGPAEA
jgi:hypothetical protein